MSFSQFLTNLVSSQAQPRFFTWIPYEKIINFKSKNILVPEASYFQINLSEMYLKDRRRYWHGYIPMAMAYCEFIYANETVTLPVYVGSNLLEINGTLLENQAIEYINTNIIGPTPYHGGDVAFFLGLFSVQVDDFSKGMFNFAENLMNTFSISQLSSYIKVADTIRTGLNTLLGFQTVKMQLGNRTVFNDMDNNAHQFKEGFLLYVNCPFEQIQPDQLWVRDDRLFTGALKTQLSPYQDNDYCLVKISGLSHRNDYSLLGFNEIFDNAVSEICNNNRSRAYHHFESLLHALSLSPDLTQDHRFQLMQLYTANYEKTWEIHSLSSKKLSPASSPVRGPLSDLSASDILMKMAYMANQDGLAKETEKGLLDLGQNMDRIVGTYDTISGLNDNELNKQLNSLSQVSQVKNSDPNLFLEAILKLYNSY